MVSKLSRRSLRKIAGDHPSHAAVAGAPPRIPSGWRPLLERYLKTLNVEVFLFPHRYRWCQILSCPSPPRYLGLWPREQVAAALGSTGQINASKPNRPI
jgi:hypothetical protein